jgi:hypothetical protein
LGGGIAGQNFGTHGVWDWESNWTSALSSPATLDMQRQFAFYASLPWQELVPSGTASGFLGKDLIVSGQGSGDAHIAAAATSSGSWLVVYVPPTGTSATTFGLDMTALSGSARARWFNPTTGVYTTIGTEYPNTGTRSFTTPGNNGSGANDWILVADATAVNSVFTSVSISPASASVAPSSTVQYTATALDQSGAPMSPQPAFSWQVSGGGTIGATGLFTAGAVGGGPFTITATSGSKTASASVTVSPSSNNQALRLNVGGGAVAPFSMDSGASGGNADSYSDVVDVTNVVNAAPASVYQTARWGNFSYTLGGFVAGSSYIVRLHFAENWWASSGQRVFNVSINGTQGLSNFDIFAAAGGAKRAVVKDLNAIADSRGQIVVVFNAVVDNASVNGIEVLSGTQATNSSAPTVASPASATPNIVTSTGTSLSVLGSDDGGEANLIYDWGVTALPAGSASFSPNHSNAAKNTTVTFTRAGNYDLSVTITDGSGLTATSNTQVTVNGKLTNIAIAPGIATVSPGMATQFTATGSDQFAAVLSPQPVFAWTVNGGGTISSSGLFSAASVGGPYTVAATSGAQMGTARVTIADASVAIGDSTVLGLDDYGNGNLLVAQKTSLGQNAAVKSLSFYVAAAAGKLRLGIYDATGGNGNPGAKRAETAEITPVVGWNTASVSGSAMTLTAGDYWLVYLPSSDSLHFRAAQSGTCVYHAQAYGPLPATFPSAVTGIDYHWSFYATLAL